MGIQDQTTELKALSDFIASDPDALNKLSNDASSVLASFGIELDETSADALRTQLGGRSSLEASAQAAIVHIDL